MKHIKVGSAINFPKTKFKQKTIGISSNSLVFVIHIVKLSAHICIVYCRYFLCNISLKKTHASMYKTKHGKESEKFTFFLFVTNILNLEGNRNRMQKQIVSYSTERTTNPTHIQVYMPFPANSSKHPYHFCEYLCLLLYLCVF